MKRFLIAIPCILLAVSACKSSSGNDSTTPEETPAHVVKATDYLPHMGAVSYILTTVQEVSGLCLAPDGDGLLAASDEDGVYHVAWDGTTSLFYVEDDMDCEGVTLDPATKDVYYIVEWDQEIRRLAAPDYSTPELLGVITEAGFGTNSGLEGITYYKDGILLVGNQRKPIRLFQFATSGEILERHDLTGTTEIADLCYDPVRDVLWIADSEVGTINLCTPAGEVLAYWDVSFIDNAEGLYVDHDHNCIWVGDDTTSRIYKILFEGL